MRLIYQREEGNSICSLKKCTFINNVLICTCKETLKGYFRRLFNWKNLCEPLPLHDWWTAKYKCAAFYHTYNNHGQYKTSQVCVVKLILSAFPETAWLNYPRGLAWFSRHPLCQSSFVAYKKKKKGNDKIRKWLWVLHIPFLCSMEGASLCTLLCSVIFIP